MEPKDGKKPEEMSDEVWEKFKALRREFYAAFIDYPEKDINDALMAHPDNLRPEDDDNELSHYILWADCPLWMTAAYYANDRLEIDKMPIPDIAELKEILDKQ
jgi:hypothetical protein